MPRVRRDGAGGCPTRVQELVGRFAQDETIPALLCPSLCQLVEEIRSLEGRIREIETELRHPASQSEVCRRLQTIPGVGLLGSTALLGSVGDIHSFDNARRFASWVGLTPRQFSSGNTRRLGRITRQGDCYVRMLLVHGARAVLHSGHLSRRAGRPLDRLREWALRLELRSCHNKAVIAPTSSPGSSGPRGIASRISSSEELRPKWPKRNSLPDGCARGSVDLRAMLVGPPQ